MQPHDHEAGITIASNLRQFLSGIAVGNERLWMKPEWQGRHQLVQAVFGQRAAVRFKPGQMEPRGERALQRLDDVHQDHRHAKQFGELARNLGLPDGRGRQIHGHENPADQPLDVLTTELARITCRRNQHWDGRLTQHPLGRRSEKQFPETSQAVSADDDELARALARNAQDLRGGLSDGHFVLENRKDR